jgi:predicted nucleotidyltransferase
MTWTTDPLERRRGEREERLDRAREYVELLNERLPVLGAAVAGSVSRGDFNLWSDVDVVVVSDALPPPGPARGEALGDAASGLEVHGYTSAEFARALKRGDRLAREAAERGVILIGTMPSAEPLD